MVSQDLMNMFRKHVSVSFSNDRMTAFVLLSSPPPSESYTMDEILIALRASGITFGISQDKIQEMIDHRHHNMKMAVAFGTPQREGSNGYFEYLFNLKVNHAPKVLPDGSIDYRSFDLVEPVKKDAVIVKYHPAVQGTIGRTVFGGVVNPMNVKDLAPLKGAGFILSEDKLTYIAKVSGKVELINGCLYVTNILVVDGDTDVSTGDIHFNGDVVIKGSVNYGYSIFAEGSVTVCGSVEAAKIVAGKNVELRNGMQGGGKGRIECLGNVSGKFFEQVTIRCQGDINANSIMHCDIETDSCVTVSGRHGIIVGGNTTALAGIKATVLGNIAEAKTYLAVGKKSEMLGDISKLEEEIRGMTEYAEKTAWAIEKLDQLNEKQPTDVIVKKINELTNYKTILMTQLTAKMNEHDIMVNRLAISKTSSISVTKYLYPEVTLVINGIVYRTSDTFNNVTVKLVSNEIKIFANR